MIELCSVKQMMIFVIGVTGMSLLILFVESRYQTPPVVEPQNDTTPAVEGTDVRKDVKPCLNKQLVHACRKCRPWEKERIEACNATGFFKAEECADQVEGDTGAQRMLRSSCVPPVSRSREVFWIHEVVLLFVGIASTVCVYSRRNKLDGDLMEKVNKQIAAGV